LIGRAAIVTNPKKLEEKLDVSIKNYMSKCIVVPQVGSIMQNAMEGYKALGEKGHTLFIAGDSPQTTKENIEEFLGISSQYLDDYDFIYPVVDKRAHRKYDKTFKRLYFKIRNRAIGEIDEVRITSMALVNPEGVGKREMINFFYSIRNIAAPQNWIKAYRVFGDDIKKAFFHNLTLADVEARMSSLMETRFKLARLEDARSSLDLDDVGDDRRIEIANGYHDYTRHNS
jgi:hypothetical protein